MDVTGILPYFILAAVFTLVITLFAFAIYSGLFRGVTVESGPPPLKKAHIVYRYSTGPYKNSGYYFTEVTSIAPKKKCLGIYYDNPEEVHDSENLRWVVACILAEGDEKPDPDLVKKFEEKGYKPFTLPAVSHAVKTSFPHRTLLSIFLGIYKVYPEISLYVREKRLCAHPALEIYNGDWIEYMFPLAKQDEFYVPETEQPEEQDEDEGGAEDEMSSEALSNTESLEDSNLPSEESLSQEIMDTGLRYRKRNVPSNESGDVDAAESTKDNDQELAAAHQIKESSVVVEKLPESEQPIEAPTMTEDDPVKAEEEPKVEVIPPIEGIEETKEESTPDEAAASQPEEAAGLVESAEPAAAAATDEGEAKVVVSGDASSDSSSGSFEKVKMEDVTK